MKRIDTNLNTGLNNEQVNIQIKNGLTNKNTTVSTKRITRIIFDNFFTLFNLLNLALALAILSVSSHKNLLFMGIVITNTLISTIQEIKSKIIVDKLSILNENKATVIRNSKIIELDIDDVVLDDIIIFKSGNQIPTDSIIIEGEVSVNESFITGESELVNYKSGDILKSGSFVVSGKCKAKVEHVALDNYTHIISKDAKYVKKINSILMNSLKKIIKIISILIVPLGILLFMNQYNVDKNLEFSILRTTAALISMIPEGLLLLTSSVLAVSTIRLSKLKVLIQEIYCIEMLARVDVICLDKTGTITDGNMEVVKVISLNNNYDVNNIMGNIVNCLDADNSTSEAIKKYFKNFNNMTPIRNIPFSSDKKYSGVEFKEGTFIYGAPEFLYDNNIKEVEENQYNRVLLLCKKEKNNIPIGVIVIKDTLRKNAKDTLNYFKEQNVDIKIISGDNLITVTNIAKEAGLKDIRAVDVSTLLDKDLKKAVLNNNIFARVNPLQKKEIIEVLQDNKHFVAMTGDGVNDVLALKQADCSITIKNASDAARNVCQLILLNNDFSSIPNIVKEGRRTINNIERSATLLLAKTTYAFFLVLVFLFANFNYPFEPIQSTLINFFTIGTPSFILALEPNNERIKGDFLKNILSKSLPTALTVVLNIIIISILGEYLNISYKYISTISVIMTAFTGFLLLYKISVPFNTLRKCLFLTLITGFIIGIFTFKSIFSLAYLNKTILLFIIILTFISIISFKLISNLIDKLIIRYSNK